MTYYRNNGEYRVSGREMLAYGYKYGAPWAEDRRALERAFNDRDGRNRGLEIGWASYSSARDELRALAPSLGSRGSAASGMGRHGTESREHDTQSLMRIGGDRGHDNISRNGHESYHGEGRSRTTTSATPRTAGNTDRDLYLREERYGRRDYGRRDYGRRDYGRRDSYYDYSDVVHERDERDNDRYSYRGYGYDDYNQYIGEEDGWSDGWSDESDDGTSSECECCTDSDSDYSD